VLLSQYAFEGCAYVVGGLVELVSDGILCCGCAAAEAGIRVLGDLLVGLLGCSGTSALDGLGHVVCGVPVDVVSK
jgi:hypothetical protein